MEVFLIFLGLCAGAFSVYYVCSGKCKGTDRKSNYSYVVFGGILCVVCLYIGIGLINTGGDDRFSDYESDLSSKESHESSYSQTTSKQYQTKSEKDRQRENLERTADFLESDGQLVIWSGYTFDQCVNKAKVYLETKYDTWFYDTSVLVSTEDMLYNYYVIGYDHKGKAFEVWITHSDDTWGVVTATIED